MKSIKLISFFLLLSNYLSAQSVDIVQLTPLQMKEDIEFLYNVIKETHPNPYQVLNPEQYERKKQDLLNSVEKPMSIYDFWLQIAQLNYFFDAHTFIHPIDNWWKSMPVYFDIPTLFVQNDSVYFSGMEGLPDSLKHKRIVGINLQPIDTIVSNMYKYFSYESKRLQNYRLETWFTFLYPLLYSSSTQLEVKYIDEHLEKEVLLTASDFEQFASSFIENNRNTTIFRPFAFKYNKENKTALFEINACAGDYEKYNEAIIQAIDSLHKYDIQHLFLDVSRNKGGTDKFVFILLNYLNFPSWDTLGKYTYCNKVYLIQSNYSFSSATTFSSYFKHHHLGIIFGEEAGGLTASYTESQTVELPNSKLKMSYATSAVVDIGGQWDGHGVFPDIAYPVRKICSFKSFTWEQLKEMLELVNNMNTDK